MDVVDAEGLEEGAEGEDKTHGKGRYGTFKCGTMTRDSFYIELEVRALEASGAVPGQPAKISVDNLDRSGHCHV